MKLNGIRGACAVLAWAFTAGSALAHTGYLMPNIFTTAEAKYVTVQGSFTEDFAQPEIAIDGKDFHFFGPDGKRGELAKVTQLKQVTLLENELNEPGTYRFTSGERLGRTGTQIYDKETKAWKGLEPGKEAPKGAKIRKSQTATVSDVYVTKGKPTQAPIDVVVGRLAIHPITHPNSLFLEAPFELDVKFDGAPLKDQKLILVRSGGSYEEPKFQQTIQTDAAGKAAIKFDKPGAYLLMTRHIADAPKGSETPVRSYTTSLTFEVTR